MNRSARGSPIRADATRATVRPGPVREPAPAIATEANHPANRPRPPHIRPNTPDEHGATR